jgi:hypothetical protein
MVLSIALSHGHGPEQTVAPHPAPQVGEAPHPDGRALHA